MTRSDDYAGALDKLDALHASGAITDSRYELMKQQLIAEATDTRPSNRTVIFRLVAIVLIIFVLILGFGLIVTLTS